MPAGQLLGARAMMDLESFTGDIEVGVSVQVANVRNSVTGTVSIEGRKTSSGVYYGSDFTDISGTTDGALLARFVWTTRNTVSSANCFARVSGHVELDERC